VKTTAGNVYFKATPALFAREPQLTQALTKYYPAHLPVVLAADFEKRWILMRDVGGKILQQVPDISLWEAALRRFAQIQIDSVQHLDSLIAQGWLDMRLDRLASQIHLLFQDALREPEIAQLLAFAPQLAALWEELAQLGVPHTLVHGDLSPRNIYVTGDNYIYFDWSDSCISHPFFDTVRFLYEIEMELTDVPDARTRLRNAYLEPWAVYEPVERLISAFERCSQTLVSLYQAILDRRLTANLEGSVKWESFAPVPFYIKRLLFQVATYLQLSLRGVY
jgi:tRNA A-37 threonylcarbamoyl transferase component Bud32